MRANQVRAQDAAGLVLDKNVEAVGRFRDSTRGVPVGCVLAVNLKLEPALACLRLAETDRCGGPFIAASPAA